MYCMHSALIEGPHCRPPRQKSFVSANLNPKPSRLRTNPEAQASPPFLMGLLPHSHNEITWSHPPLLATTVDSSVVLQCDFGRVARVLMGAASLDAHLERGITTEINFS